MKKNSFVLLLVLLYSIAGCNSYADKISKPLAVNEHIRVIAYSPNEVHRYTGYYGYAASIVFESGEKILTISMGDPTAWQITPSDNRLFIKPVQDNPETNALIITNRRVYHFILNAREANGLDDKNLVFETRFTYPSVAMGSYGENGGYVPDVNDPRGLNFDYLVSGAAKILPLRVFDDGKFTYLEFRKTAAVLPAVFLVEPDGYESLVNIRTVEKYLIIEKIAPLFTLRYDKEHACVFNMKNPYSYAQSSKNHKSSKSDSDNISKNKHKK